MINYWLLSSCVFDFSANLKARGSLINNNNNRYKTCQLHNKVIILDISVLLTSEMIENHDFLFVSNRDHEFSHSYEETTKIACIY